MERLELSKQKLLGPKSSASTNFATSAFCNNSNNIKIKNKSLNRKVGFKDLFVYFYAIKKTRAFSAQN